MKAMAAMTRGQKQCQRRSWKRLLLQPTPIMAMAVGTYRVLVMRASLALCHACIIMQHSTSVSEPLSLFLHHTGAIHIGQDHLSLASAMFHEAVSVLTSSDTIKEASTGVAATVTAQTIPATHVKLEVADTAMAETIANVSG